MGVTPRRRCRPSLPAASLAAGLLLPALGCIEDRLAVNVTTYVHADGSCVRRVEYRLERVDGESGRTLEVKAPEDPLRLYHRFPDGERWSVRDEARPTLHVVSAEARLDSPNDLDWDFWRRRAPAAAPARNFVSFAMSADRPDAALYEYAETFLDPASPLEGARALGRLLLKREDDFARRVAAALGPAAPRREDVRRAYRERLAQPFSRELERLSSRPIHGPREQRELEALLDRLDALDDDLTAALVALSPVAAPVEPEQKLKPASDAFGEAILSELQASGAPLPHDLGEPVQKLRFRVTLVMPAAITRANTCWQGDTAVWEFDQDDLFGRGFEMWARAGGR